MNFCIVLEWLHLNMLFDKSIVRYKSKALRCLVFIIVILSGQSFFVVSAAVPNHPTIVQDSDTISYYADYSDLLALRIYTNTKWNSLDIIKDDQRLSLRPNSPTSLGVGFNYKEYGLAIAFGLPKSATSNKNYGKTKRLDLQMNIYKPKFGFDGIGQIYRGYYNSNPEDFVEWENETFPQLPDMQVVSIGLNAFYIFNSDRFSYKAAFIRNQIQLKSAGSFTAGVFGHYDAVKTDNGFKPKHFPDSIATDFDLKVFSTLAIGVSAGYLYTWAISEHFFINIGFTPGFGNQRIEIETIEGQKSVKNTAAAQLTARSAVGYDSKFFYVGVTGVVTWRNFQYKGYDLDLATEQIKVFIGKRFSISGKN